MPIYAVCPFFMYEKAKQIKCEAYLFNFPNHQHKRKLTKNFAKVLIMKSANMHKSFLKNMRKEVYRNEINS